MAKREQLRKTRTGTVINEKSSEQEKEIALSLDMVKKRLDEQFKVRIIHRTQWYLREIVERLRRHFPDEEFHHYFNSSSIKPDGGILYMLDKEDNEYPILISEVKRQGTNDLRKQEGLPKQSKGNAIERLGKNVIGLRTAMLNESIFPFICFGYGNDFNKDSAILDRVVTIAMFGKLNKIYLHNSGEHSLFNRGSFYFREEPWNINEMIVPMYEISERSIYYYFSRYGKQRFDII